jgi:hypothetical protein
MKLMESKEEPERDIYLRLLGNYGIAQPQLSHPSATSTEGHTGQGIPIRVSAPYKGHI